MYIVPIGLVWVGMDLFREVSECLFIDYFILVGGIKMFDKFVEWLGVRLASVHLFPDQRAKLYADILVKAREYKERDVLSLVKNQIREMKHDADSFTNTDYLTGYVSALSTLEGYLAGLEDGDADDL